MDNPRKRLCQRDKESESETDQLYFNGYASIEVHEEMLMDTVRTMTYREAILKNQELFKDKVIADIGAGTGILSIFCIHAGAKKVYAIEASNMVVQTQLVIKENGMDSKISVIKGKVEDIVLPEKVDIIVSEWMGYCLLYESMLKSVIHARDTWLKSNGYLFPSTATLYIAPFVDEDYEDRLGLWEDMASRYKVAMKSMIPFAKKCISANVELKQLMMEDIVAPPVQVCSLAIHQVTLHDIENIQQNFEFKCYGWNRVHGFSLWFDVEFPGNIILSTSPFTELTHWSQVVLYVHEPFQTVQDTTIKGKIKLEKGKQPRDLAIQLKFAVDDSEMKEQLYDTGYWTTGISAVISPDR
ncbi:protein arginine N-methyltransferase 6-like [Octopus vulgaris]|uniref:Protein arginine N-methyltransferase 6-like n=2 Tax=Octopus TaxID=6643 RepID=A0AA36B4A6_OCTVU|nr:protein arginine N-methyltransferase 6 [Octopus sinensis]CAI9727668.1 protein arginine N-methyltransferase 6-like [Octopus vulgaris]